MKWAAAIIVALSFLYGLLRGWQEPHRDLIFYPLAGFIVGLFVFWLLRAAIRGLHKQLDDRGVGTALYWVSTVVALYYVGLVVLSIYLGHWDSFTGWLVGFAAVCWGLGWAIRRGFATKTSN